LRNPEAFVTVDRSVDCYKAALHVLTNDVLNSKPSDDPDRINDRGHLVPLIGVELAEQNRESENTRSTVSVRWR
jgi:hypothetical protein